ncbi:MAG: DUF177 domain-containing protein [Chloroflexota bacterium]
MKPDNNLLRLDIGSLTRQPVGFSRDFTFDIPKLQLRPDLELLNFNGKALAVRTSKGLLIQAEFRAEMVTECVRCLEQFTLPLHPKFNELYAFSPSLASDSVSVLPEGGLLNLAPLVAEYMLLEVPINPLCRSDCRGLCPECGENLNQTSCDHGKGEIDPRFEMLRSLLDKLDESEQ